MQARAFSVNHANTQSGWTSVVLCGDLIPAVREDAHPVEVGEPAPRPAGHRVVGVDGEAEGLFVEQPAGQLGRRPLVDECQVEVAFAKHPQLVDAAGVGERDRRAGDTIAKHLEYLVEPIRRYARWEAGAHDLPGRPGRACDLAAGIGQPQDEPGVFVEGHRGGGGTDARGHALEQGRVQPALELVELARQRGLGDEQVLGRPRDGAVLEDRDEVPQLP
jgi:hypothetical protein